MTGEYTSVTQRDAAATKKQNLCTTESPRHGESENKWVLFGPLIPGCIQKNQDLDISNFSLQQKFEDTEVLFVAGIRRVARTCARNKNSGRGNSEMNRHQHPILRQQDAQEWDAGSVANLLLHHGLIIDDSD